LTRTRKGISPGACSPVRPTDPASRPASPGGSSRKSNDGSAGLVDAALKAAESTFRTPSRLPLEHDPATSSGPVQGRKRLAGASLLDIARVRPDPLQPRKRFDAGAQAELVASVKRHGTLQPITVRYVSGDDVYQVIAGERRYLAARTAGLPEIPCWIQTPREEEKLQAAPARRGAPVSYHRFKTAGATVSLTFRRKEVTTEDMLGALDEVRAIVERRGSK